MIVGIDEVGRGCWAGPLVVCGVGMTVSVDGLRDSKQLSHKKRLELLELIKVQGNHTYLSWTEPVLIDEYGLSLAMEKACEDIFSYFSKLNPSRLIIDGNINYLPDVTISEAIIKADDSIMEVSAASIVAKEARDDYMKELDLEVPEFNFKNNVGYGTKDHAEALEEHGVTKYHRQSFKPVRKYVSEARFYGRGGGN